MFIYEKKLQFPVNISNPDPKLAKIIITQLGGPDGELAASMRYLNQRYSMPVREVKALLTDIGTEELSHLEIVSAIIYQLTRNLCIDDIKEAGFDEYFVDHTTGIYTQAASGNAFTAAYFQSKGDPITDLMEDMAAEQKARTTYENILRLTDDPDVCKPIEFLRAREIVHFQRFGEALNLVRKCLDKQNYYRANPAFDCPECCQRGTHCGWEEDHEECHEECHHDCDTHEHESHDCDAHEHESHDCDCD